MSKIEAHLPVTTTIDVPNMSFPLKIYQSPTRRYQILTHRRSYSHHTRWDQSHSAPKSFNSFLSFWFSIDPHKNNCWFLKAMSDTGTVTQKIGTQPQSIYFPLNLKEKFICFKGYAQLLCCLADKDKLTMLIHSERYRLNKLIQRRIKWLNIQ